MSAASPKKTSESAGISARPTTEPNSSLRVYPDTMIPKHTYVRSKKLLQAVASLDCQHCGSGQSVQAAHTNWGGGKGRSVKADDNLTAALCLRCHFEVDQGHRLSKAERQAIWEAAHKKTVETLLAQNLWPDNVPVPQW